MPVAVLGGDLPLQFRGVVLQLVEEVLQTDDRAAAVGLGDAGGLPLGAVVPVAEGTVCPQAKRSFSWRWPL